MLTKNFFLILFAIPFYDQSNIVKKYSVGIYNSRQFK
jgi:hypothetical protein